MNLKLLIGMLIVLLAFVVVSGCKLRPGPASTALSSPLESLVSPVTTPRAVEIQPFQLDRPIVSGTTHVTGRGPARVPIKLVDITFGGYVLAMGVIDRNGRFDLRFSTPIEVDHRVGLTIGNLAGTSWTARDFQGEEFYGPEARSVPQIGFFYDTYMVRE